MNKIFSLLGLCFFCMWTTLPHAQGQWTWSNPWPQGNDLKFIHVFEDGEILAAGDDGTMVRSTNNGLDWQVEHFALGPDIDVFELMQFVDDNTFWATNDMSRGSDIYFSGDRGVTWEKRTPTPIGITGFFALDAENAWGISRVLFRTTDGGQTWTQFRVEATGFWEAGGIFFLDENTGWAVGTAGVLGGDHHGKILKTTNGGLTWNVLFTNPCDNTSLGEVFFLDENTGWAGGEDALIMKTTDGGQTWTTQYYREDTNYAILDFLFYDKDHGIAVGTDNPEFIDGRWEDRGLVLTTSDGGQTWEKRESTTDGWVRDIYPVGDSTIWACGSFGLLMKSDDRGQSWTQANKGVVTRDFLTCIAFSDENTGWTGGGSNGRFLKTEDGGESWFIAGYGQHPVTVFQFLDPQNGYRIEWSGQTYRTRDGGNSWELTDVLGRDGLYLNGCFSDTSNGWLIFTLRGDSFVKKTTDGAQSWQTVLSTPTIWLSGIDFVNATTGWVCGANNPTIQPQKGFLYKTTDAGATWQEQLGGIEPLTNVDFIDENTGWCVGAFGTMLATTDGGESWNRVTIPFEQPTGLFFLDANSGWVFGNDGIARTFDAGLTWESFVTPNGQGAFRNAAYFTSMDSGWLVGGIGQILKFDGNVTAIDADDTPLQVPSTVTLYQNYPNPFNPETTITYTLPRSAEVKISIFNTLGQRVRTFRQGTQPAGHYQVHWDGRNNAGQTVSSGVYVYQMVAGGFKQVRKMLLLR